MLSKNAIFNIFLEVNVCYNLLGGNIYPINGNNINGKAGRVLQVIKTLIPLILLGPVVMSAFAGWAGEPAVRRANLDIQKALLTNPAWITADNFLTNIYQWHNEGRQSAEERTTCLHAAWEASRIVTADKNAARIFLDPAESFLLLVAQAAAESGGNPRAISKDGRDFGWAQINIRMLHILQVKDPFDVCQNAAGQARLMRDLLDNLITRWGEEKPRSELIRLALGAYNAGGRTVVNGHVPAAARAYVARAYGYFQRLRDGMGLGKLALLEHPSPLPAWLYF